MIKGVWESEPMPESPGQPLRRPILDWLCERRIFSIKTPPYIQSMQGGVRLERFSKIGTGPVIPGSLFGSLLWDS